MVESVQHTTQMNQIVSLYMLAQKNGALILSKSNETISLALQFLRLLLLLLPVVAFEFDSFMLCFVWIFEPLLAFNQSNEIQPWKHWQIKIQTEKLHKNDLHTSFKLHMRT